MANYQLAQLNLAQMRLPLEHPDMADFVENIDRVNALAGAFNFRNLFASP